MAQPAFEVSGFLSELTATTNRTIVPEVSDNVMCSDPFLALLRAQRLATYPGGTQIDVPFLYAAEGGGFVTPGTQFDISRKQTITAGSWQPKEVYVPITELLEQLNVYNKPPAAVVKIVDTKMQGAALTMSARLAVASYLGGQGARIAALNGLAEILNDGTNAQFDGTTYANYGTVPRNGTIGSALNSPMTGPTANLASTKISQRVIETAINSVVVGNERPNTLITTNLGMSYIRLAYQSQWRTETVDPKVGLQSLVVSGAKLYQSQYAPGSVAPPDGTNLGFSTITGESLFILNDRSFKLYISDDPLFGFGFTGFKVAQNSTEVSGQYLFMGNIVNIQPRFSRVLFGFTS